MDLRRLVKVSWGRGLLFFDGVWGIGLQACRKAHSVVGSIFMCVCPAGGQRRPPAFLHAAAVNIPSVPGFRLMNKGRKATADPSTHHPPPPPQRRRPVAGDPGTPPQRRRPVAGDPGTEVRLGPLSLRMTVHLFCNSLKRVGLLPMNKGCEARVWRPARQPVWRPALLSEVLFSLDVTCDASRAAPYEQRPKGSRRSLHCGRDDSVVGMNMLDDFGVHDCRNLQRKTGWQICCLARLSLLLRFIRHTRHSFA